MPRPISTPHRPCRAWAMLALAIGASVCLATPQSGPGHAAVPSAAPAASAPAAGASTSAARRPLADYRPYNETTGPGWRAANELVARIGGWRSYAREAPLADAATPSTPAPSPATAPPAPASAPAAASSARQQ